MERTACTLADILVKKSIIEKQDRDFYRYAIETVLVYAINLSTMLVLAVVTGRLVELLVFFAAFYPLRTNCGGKHMNTWYGCYVLSCITVEAVLFVSDVVHIHIAVMSAILSVCIGCIWLFAPIEHHNHPMEEKDCIRARSKVRIFSICVAMTAFIFKYFDYETGAFLCTASEVLCLLLLASGIADEKKYSLKNNVEI